MSRAGRDESPDRLYTLTGGRSKPDFDRFDLVTLVVSECEPNTSMSSEDAAILRMCRAPTAVVEIAAELGIPVGIATILLSDLLHAGKITVRHPHPADSTAPEQPWTTLPDRSTIEKVLVGLRNL